MARAIKDFSMSDLYYHILWTGDEPEKSEVITLVDITDLHKRGQIAQTIEEVNKQHPKALGLDIIFEGLKDDSIGNDSLVNALSDCSSERLLLLSFLTIMRLPRHLPLRSTLSSSTMYL